MITDEVFHLSRHGHIGSINEVKKLPTYVRRYYLYKINDEVEKENEQIKKAQRKNSSSGFKSR